MILMQKFKEHMTQNPRIAIAFEAFKINLKVWYEKWPESAVSEAEFYRANISNFIHGAFRCTQETKIITSWNELRLRTANIEDYDFINAAERDEDCIPWVNNWPLGARIEKFGDCNFLQTIIETTQGCPIGFIDFRDMLNETQVELKRIVITDRGKGYGKKAMYLSQKFAFEVLNRNRLYLGTKVANVRAQRLYHVTGFTLIDPANIAYFHIMKEDYQFV